MITKNSQLLLKPHQQKVIDKLSDDDLDGIIAYHSMGAGKTATALQIAERVLEKERDGKVLFITPASLQDNIFKERDKHALKVPDDRIIVRSYEKAVRDKEELLKQKYPLLVLDEAHKLRNPATKRSQFLRDLAGNVDKKLLMTGTAAYNHPADLGNLTALINPDLKIPKTQTEFESEFIDSNTGKLTGRGKKFLKKIRKYVDLYEVSEDPDIQKHFPRTSTSVIQTEMSKPQQKVYKYLEGDLPPHLRKSIRKNLPLSLQKSKDLNAFASGVRQASTGHFPYTPSAELGDATKLRRAAQSMAEAAKEKPGFRGVAYSNYLKAGVHPYSQILRDEGIDPLVLTGSLSRKEKDALIGQYNTVSENPKVLVLSSSGGEGLDLKGTRKMQILEPHFNESKINQIKARASRYGSHDHLPEGERTVDVEEYQSTFRPTWYQKLFGIEPDTTIDKYLSDLSERKQNTIEGMKALL